MREVYKRNTPAPVQLAGEDRDEFGHLTLAQSFPNLGMVQIRQGYDFVATAGQQTFHDVEVTTELRLSGGKAWMMNGSSVHIDDYMEFSIVDKNDILGYFAYYGLEVGVDVLLLEKFIRTVKVKKGDSASGYAMTFEPSSIHGDPVMVGLFMRASYMSYGDTDIHPYYEIIFYED